MKPRYRVRMFVCYVILVALGVGTSAGAQEFVDTENWLAKHNPFRHADASQPISVPELCRRLDCLAEKLRDDGLVVLKQPDVFSQARMTRFRNDFEAQMSSDLANFHLVLAARINRLDAATTTQTTALSSALAAPGTTNGSTPVFPDVSKFYASPSNPGLDPTKTVFGGIGLAPSTMAIPSNASATLGLGVDPTVYLDEKKRFLEHLNQIRRISLGPDQNDSSGYGLYLVRLPISITPGEKTYHGFGAELAVHVEHEFPPDFLPTSFRNLVINDVVDQLGPVVYEAIRSGYYANHLKPWHDARAVRLLTDVRMSRLVDDAFTTQASTFVDGLLKAAVGAPPTDPALPIVNNLRDFILAPTVRVNGNPENDLPLYRTFARRLDALADAVAQVAGTDDDINRRIATLRAEAENARQSRVLGHTLPVTVDNLARTLVESTFGDLFGPSGRKSTNYHNSYIYYINNFNKPNLKAPSWNLSAIAALAKSLYRTALPPDVGLLGPAFTVEGENQERLAGATAVLSQQSDALKAGQKLNLPSTRTAKQLYPVAPRDVLDVFLYENVYLLAKGALESSRTFEVRSSDVRNYLRHTLSSAFAAMTHPTPKSVQASPLDDPAFMEGLLTAINQREFGGVGSEVTDPDKKPLLIQYNEALVARLSEGRENIAGQPIAALCWAIAVDAALLDRALRNDAKQVFAANEKPAFDSENIRLYHTKKYYQDNPGDPALNVFNEYVRVRWPIIAFGLDPVTDQQNIADSFNLKRDLQLALSYAFSTGQIGFSQLNTFRRQIEQSSDTIALNRTVTGFVHGNDIFGFRFTPRFQNPPNQRTNVGVIASQLIGGGPGPDYQMKKSKLESGMRELTVVMLAPTFLTTMRMDVTSNWFRLNDPEHLVFHTKRMMEQGRMVQELRQTVLDACSAQQYRQADLRVLNAKLAMLEAMLPAQSKVMPLPFENSASGFDLLSDGATALVPELTGYSGVDVIQMPSTPPATVAVVAGTPGLQVTTATTAPTTITTTSIVGGSASLADVFIFGKYISLLDTKVIAGGRSAAFEILSREVVHVQIPANAVSTTTEDNKTYIEVFLATPNGSSNSLLLPCKVPASTPPTPVAYDLSTASVDIFYQWTTDGGGKPVLVATADPGKKGPTISWESTTGIAPKRLQVTFQGTVGSYPISFSIPADPSGTGDYTVNPQVFAATLLNRVQQALTSPATAPSPLSLTVFVQPWIPRDTEEFRVKTDAKKLPKSLTVNLNYQITGKNALPGVNAASHAPNGGGEVIPKAGPGAAIATRTVDESVRRTAQLPSAIQLPSTPPAALDLPQLPPELDTRILQSPNVTSEAEQVARMLTGVPSNPNRTIPTQLSQAAGSGAGGQPTQATTTVSTTTTSAPGGQPIIVMPAPVVVVPPKPDAKHKGHFRPVQTLKKLGNRISQGGALVPGS